ncbi:MULTISPECIES: hypothetical protein [Enterococcus]|nr:MULTISPECIES: hypothetical protein [unclassified Enterococcus]
MFDFWVIALFAVGCWSWFRWLRLQLNKAKMPGTAFMSHFLRQST